MNPPEVQPKNLAVNPSQGRTKKTPEEKELAKQEKILAKAKAKLDPIKTGSKAIKVDFSPAK